MSSVFWETRNMWVALGNWYMWPCAFEQGIGSSYSANLLTYPWVFTTIGTYSELVITIPSTVNEK